MFISYFSKVFNFFFPETTYKKHGCGNDVVITQYFFSFIVYLYGIPDIVFAVSIACLHRTHIRQEHGVCISVFVVLSLNPKICGQRLCRIWNLYLHVVFREFVLQCFINLVLYLYINVEVKTSHLSFYVIILLSTCKCSQVCMM